MVGRMGGGFHFLVEIELKMAKMPAFTNLNTTSKLDHTATPIMIHQNWLISVKITHLYRLEPHRSRYDCVGKFYSSRLKYCYIQYHIHKISCPWIVSHSYILWHGLLSHCKHWFLHNRFLKMSQKLFLTLAAPKVSIHIIGSTTTWVGLATNQYTSIWAKKYQNIKNIRQRHP